MSKPSIPSLVGQIVRQQNLRCPFLVISGGNECYHNPLSHSILPSLSLCFTLSLSVPCQASEKPLSISAPKFHFCSIKFSSCPFLAPLPPCLCQYTPVLFVLTGHFRICCFGSPLPPSLRSALWSFCGLALCAGDWTVRDDVQGKPQLIKNTLDLEAVVLH